MFSHLKQVRNIRLPFTHLPTIPLQPKVFQDDSEFTCLFTGQRRWGQVSINFSNFRHVWNPLWLNKHPLVRGDREVVCSQWLRAAIWDPCFRKGWIICWWCICNFYIRIPGLVFGCLSYWHGSIGWVWCNEFHTWILMKRALNSKHGLWVLRVRKVIWGIFVTLAYD